MQFNTLPRIFLEEFPQSTGSFITCIEHRYAVVLFSFSGHDASFSLM
jgi:hypothetical protein